MKPSIAEGGYFLMCDISACRDIIPKKYLESHDYLPEGEMVGANRIFILRVSIDAQNFVALLSP